LKYINLPDRPKLLRLIVLVFYLIIVFCTKEQSPLRRGWLLLCDGRMDGQKQPLYKLSIRSASRKEHLKCRIAHYTAIAQILNFMEMDL